MQPDPQTTDAANAAPAPEHAFDIFPDAAPPQAPSLLQLLAAAPRLAGAAPFRFRGPPPGAPRLGPSRERTR